MNKQQIRVQSKQMLKQLQKLKAEKQLKEERILDSLFHSTSWQEVTHIATTISTPLEVSTAKVILQGWQAGKKIYLPKCYPKRKMTFHLYQRTDPLVKSQFGIYEPEGVPHTRCENLDLVIVPGLAFRLDGYRIGFGGGYYDTFLATYKGETLSLAFQEQLTAEWEPDPFDIAVQQIITD